MSTLAPERIAELRRTVELAADVARPDALVGGVALTWAELSALLTLAETSEQTRALLADPVAVVANMLLGSIAKPDIRDMLHVYGADALARWDAAETSAPEPADSPAVLITRLAVPQSNSAPEPCLKGRCWSPTACNGWGYCRERNEGADLSVAQIREFRAEARARAADTEGGR